MTDTLVYMCYGKPRYREETMFSILSAYHWMGKSKNVDIVVYTDIPSDFAWLNVSTRMIDQDLLDRWMGSGTYPFRRKVACLADILKSEGGKCVFADGDTYFRYGPSHLFDRVSPGHMCLHMREIRLTSRENTAGAILGGLFLRNEVRDLRGAPVSLNAGEGMWNSGIIGIDAHDGNLLDEALHLMDEIWVREQRVHTVEQFALGHVMGTEGKLCEADDIVFHYWKDALRGPFLKRLPDILARARTMPLDAAARWSYDFRPLPSIRARWIGHVRNMAHRLGVDQRWTRTSV